MAAFLDSLPPVLRRAIVAVWAAAFLGVVFVVLPREVAAWNRELGWPRWETAFGRAAGALLFAGGLGLSLYCSRLFARLGKGTPVPIDPPKELVASGLYRFSRNPIYVAQVSILVSYFLYSGELALLGYAAVWALLVQAFVVWVEEPGLRRRFGVSYDRYTREVPRWIGIRSRRRQDVA